MRRALGGHQRVAESGGRHSQNPFVAVALKDGRAIDVVLCEGGTDRVGVLAVKTPEIRLPGKLCHADGLAPRKPMRVDRYNDERLAADD